VLPKRSSGVLLAPFGDRYVAYDQVAETTHWLNGTAGVLLTHCDGSTSRDDLVTDNRLVGMRSSRCRLRVW